LLAGRDRRGLSGELPAARGRVRTAKRKRSGRNEVKDGGQDVSWLARGSAGSGAGKKLRRPPLRNPDALPPDRL